MSTFTTLSSSFNATETSLSNWYASIDQALRPSRRLRAIRHRKYMVSLYRWSLTSNHGPELVKTRAMDLRGILSIIDETWTQAEGATLKSPILAESCDEGRLPYEYVELIEVKMIDGTDLGRRRWHKVKLQAAIESMELVD